MGMAISSISRSAIGTGRTEPFSGLVAQRAFRKALDVEMSVSRLLQAVPASVPVFRSGQTLGSSVCPHA